MLTKSSQKTYKLIEKEKKRLHSGRIIEIEHGSFTPLLMSATSGMGRECKKFYSRLAKMISLKRGTGYNITAIYCSDPLEQSFSGDAYVSECFSNV